MKRRFAKQVKTMLENEAIDHHITWAEDERTELAKNDMSNPARVAIDTAHARATTRYPWSIL